MGFFIGEKMTLRGKHIKSLLKAIPRWDGKLPTYLCGDSLPAPLMQLKEQK